MGRLPAMGDDPVLRGRDAGRRLDGRRAAARRDDRRRSAPPAPTPRRADDVVDLAGHVLLTAAVEPHAHLDKAFLAERLVNRTGDLLGAIEAMVAARPVARRRRHGRAGRAGGPADGPQRLPRRAHPRRHDARPRPAQHRGARRGAPAGRRRHRRRRSSRMCGWPVAGPDGARPAGAAARRRWRSAPTSSAAARTSTSPRRPATETYLEIAAEHGVGVDLHTDETLDPTSTGCRRPRRARGRATGFPHPVTASHCVSLGMQTAGPPAGDRRGRRRGRHRRRRPAGDQPLPAGPRPPGGDAAWADRGARPAATPASSSRPAPTTCRTRSTRSGRACPFETAALTVLTTHLLPDDAWACGHRAVGAGDRPPPGVDRAPASRPT